MSPDYGIALGKLQGLVEKHGSQVAAAKALGISVSYFNDLIRGRREFSEAVLKKLGLKVQIVVDR